MPTNAVSSSPEATSAAARRARKREQDRRCQRLARERTKSRIAHLESLVAELSQQNKSAQLEAVWGQRDKVAAERDGLLQVLRTIDNAIQSNESVRRHIAPREYRGRGMGHGAVESLPAASDGNGDKSSEPGPPSDSSPVVDIHLGEDDSRPDSHEPEPPEDEGGCSAWENGMPLASTSSDFELLPGQFISASPTILAPSPLAELGLQRVVAAETHQCECSASSTSAGQPQVNLWKFANETLSELTELSSHDIRREADFEQDIPIRAVIEGWDAAVDAADGKLPPSWNMLRRIDETLFSTCAKTERLAILRSMHSLFLAHKDPSPSRLSGLPAWYSPRPSQLNIIHSYGTDFFAWPGIRERFVFNEHRYCSNLFWTLFCQTLHILWPFEFRDCYTSNVFTRKYEFSSTFLDRLKDIKVWAMSGEILEMWPEFSTDIPIYNSIPRSPSLQPPRKQLTPRPPTHEWGALRQLYSRDPNNVAPAGEMHHNDRPETDNPSLSHDIFSIFDDFRLNNNSLSSHSRFDNSLEHVNGL